MLRGLVDGLVAWCLVTLAAALSFVGAVAVDMDGGTVPAVLAIGAIAGTGLVWQRRFRNAFHLLREAATAALVASPLFIAGGAIVGHAAVGGAAWVRCIGPCPTVTPLGPVVGGVAAAGFLVLLTWAVAREDDRPSPPVARR